MPGAPALVTELAPAHEPGRRLLGAVRATAAETVRACGLTAAEIVGSRSAAWRTEHAGSFAAWGAPHVSVGAGRYLPELVARYALGPGIAVSESRAHIAPLTPDALTVVVVDGSAGLTPRAPLSLVPGARELHEETLEFLAGGGKIDVATSAERGVAEPELWGELAALDVVEAELVDADDSLGVGAYVALWEVRA